MVETQEERKRRHHQEDLQRLREFRPIDDTFMRCLFRNDLPLVELVLRIITGNNREFVSYLTVKIKRTAAVSS